MIFKRAKSALLDQYRKEMIDWAVRHNARDPQIEAIQNAKAKDAPELAFHLGLWTYRDTPDLARSAFMFVIESRHPEYSTRASFIYATMLWDQKEYSEAHAHFMRAVNSKHADHAPAAATAYAERLVDIGQFDLVPSLYQYSIVHGDFYNSTGAKAAMERLREQGKV